MSSNINTATDSFLLNVENQLIKGPPPPNPRPVIFNSIALDTAKVKKKCENKELVRSRRDSVHNVAKPLIIPKYNHPIKNSADLSESSIL